MLSSLLCTYVGIVNLHPVQLVRIKTYGSVRPNAFFLPKRALLQKKEKISVYLINIDNQLEVKEVSIGEWYGEYRIITGGLKSGDRIIADGISQLRPGMTVHVQGRW